jgi:hypothetical protein
MYKILSYLATSDNAADQIFACRPSCQYHSQTKMITAVSRTKISSLPQKANSIKHDGPQFPIGPTHSEKDMGVPCLQIEARSRHSTVDHGQQRCRGLPYGRWEKSDQIPAVAFDVYEKHRGRTAGGGVTLVVSPLVALVKDQVDALKKRGAAAAAIDSTQCRHA